MTRSFVENLLEYVELAKSSWGFKFLDEIAGGKDLPGQIFQIRIDLTKNPPASVNDDLIELDEITKVTEDRRLIEGFM